jgi:tetratricopeptide (TPR) repeat protein
LLDINPEEYIRKREENRKISASILEVDNILAAVYYRLKTSQNFSEKGNPILKMLEKTVSAFSKDKSLKDSSKLRFRIYEAVTQILLQRHEYETLEQYLSDTYKEFLKDKLFQKDNHKTKVQMLHYLVNASFKNKKYEESLAHAEEMHAAMKEYGNLLYHKFIFFYYNSLVINYSLLNKDKAISILDDLIAKRTLKSQPFYEVFVYLNLSILWFEKSDFRNAIRYLNKLYTHPEFKNADISLKFKIAIAELIIRFELLDFDFLETRIRQVRKEFSKLLSAEEQKREKEFLYILGKMIGSPMLSRDKKLLVKIKSFLSQKSALDDTEVINYSTWLKGKVAGSKL